MAETATLLFLHRFSRKATVAVIVIGGLALIGWGLDIRVLRSVLPQLVAMNPVTAILLIFAGIGLQFLTSEEFSGRKVRRAGYVFGGIVFLCGLLKVLEYILGVPLLFDDRAFPSLLESGGFFPANEIAINSAFAFLLIGLGLMLFDVETKGEMRPAQVLFVLAGLIALIALVGYAYRVLPLYMVGSSIPMALNTAIGFALLVMAALASQPKVGLMRPIASGTTGGAMARRLLPAALILPFLLGGLRLIGEKRGYFNTEPGVSMYAVANMVVFTVLIWWNARLLYRAEQERALAERRLAVQYAASRALAESGSVKDGIQRSLQAFGETMDWPVGTMWQVDEAAGVARCLDTWHEDGLDLSSFAEACRKATVTRNAGLPGRAWGENRPVWIDDVTKEGGMVRGPAALQAGLRTAFAFPIRCEKHLFGIMEFFSRSPTRPDRALLDLFDSTGNQIGQFIERKRAEEQLRQLTAELTRSNTELQQFAYVASHDLTEPLRMIRSYLELVSHRAQNGLDAESQEFVSYALDGAKRMQGLMADLLAYARVGSRVEPFEPTDCESVLQAAMANLQLSIAENDAVVEHDPLPTVLADPFQLTQLFQNLIGNAIKFRGSAPPRIHIAAQRQNGQWEFRVRDNGIGIDPKNFERVFVLFQRLHTRQEYPGTGMGLAICKKIVERHGGRLWVSSGQGQGSTFHFTLPARNETGG